MRDGRTDGGRTKPLIDFLCSTKNDQNLTCKKTQIEAFSQLNSIIFFRHKISQQVPIHTVSCRSTLVDITSASYILIDQHLKILININIKIFKMLIDQNLEVDQSKYN